ncbi:MAG: hypothetical protein ABIF77_14720 [bacterium]
MIHDYLHSGNGLGFWLSLILMVAGVSLTVGGCIWRLRAVWRSWRKPVVTVVKNQLLEPSSPEPRGTPRNYPDIQNVLSAYQREAEDMQEKHRLAENQQFMTGGEPQPNPDALLSSLLHRLHSAADRLERVAVGSESSGEPNSESSLKRWGGEVEYVFKASQL